MSRTQSTGSPEAGYSTLNRKRLVFSLIALLAVLTGVLAVALVARDQRLSGEADAAEAQRVRELDQAQRQALVAGDAGALDRILAADFVLVPPPGEKESRYEYLRSIASGDLDYQAFEPISPVDVRVSGTVAVVTYESHLEVTAGGLHVEHDAWHTHIYRKHDGQWQQVWAPATAVGGFPPP
jgi:ketosteroid isomerase-like protein